MAAHTPPPSGNRRQLTSANAGAFIHQSVAAVLPGARKAPDGLFLPVVRGANLQSVGGDYSHFASAYAGTASDKNPAPIQENAGRDFGNPNSAFYLSYPCWPTISRAAAWQAGPNANPSQAHAAPRIHGASR